MQLEHSIYKGVGIYATAPPSLKELSRVEKAEVKKKKDDALVVRYGDKFRCVLNHFTPEAKEGDIVTIHYGYAIEVLTL